jgi:hypothetical protein
MEDLHSRSRTVVVKGTRSDLTWLVQKSTNLEEVGAQTVMKRLLWVESRARLPRQPETTQKNGTKKEKTSYNSAWSGGVSNCIKLDWTVSNTVREGRTNYERESTNHRRLRVKMRNCWWGALLANLRSSLWWWLAKVKEWSGGLDCWKSLVTWLVCGWRRRTDTVEDMSRLDKNWQDCCCCAKSRLEREWWRLADNQAEQARSARARFEAEPFESGHFDCSSQNTSRMSPFTFTATRHSVSVANTSDRERVINPLCSFSSVKTCLPLESCSSLLTCDVFGHSRAEIKQATFN